MGRTAMLCLWMMRASSNIGKSCCNPSYEHILTKRLKGRDEPFHESA